MKTSIKLFAFGMILMGFGVNVNAQVSATATTNAIIITPIAILKTVDMDFGNVAVSPTIGGTVVLTPGSTRTKTDGVTLPAVSGTVTAASFTVSGLGTSTYAITLPSTVTLTGAPSGTMTVGTFTSTPSGTGTLSGGTQTLLVGATLNVAAAQPAGTYSNASDLSVTVNYN